MTAQWTVKVRCEHGDKFKLDIFALTREEAKDEALRIAGQFVQGRCTVEHIACTGAHPRPFAKTQRGKQRRDERKFERRNKHVAMS